ncbi:MAG TPA: carboxypeptidase-like regulatory domain-containing protein [Thermoanaerobaculia bacterium]|jgi:hypothetical protein
MRTCLRSLALLLLFAAPVARAAVTGRVITEEGTALAGARVRAYVVEPSDTAALRVLSDTPEATPFATVTTAADGAFRLDAKGNGVVELLVDAEGRSTMLVRAADHDDAGTLVLPPGKPRRGRVTSGGKGIANAAVIVGNLLAFRTNEEGWWEGPETTSPLHVLVRHPDYASLERNRFRENDDASMTLAKGIAVRGRVVAEDGETPVPGGVVWVDGWPLATSAEDGSFAIAHAPPDWKTMLVRAGSRAAVATNRGAASLTLRLGPAGTIAGAVRSAKDDVAVPGAIVTLTGDGSGARGLRRVIADAKGNYAFDAMPPGSWNVVASHPGFITDAAQTRVNAGQRVARAVVLQPWARLVGTVVDEERKPVAGARFSVVRDTANPASSAPDGSFVLRFAPFEWPVRVAVAREGYAVAFHGPLKLEPGETRRATITLPRGFLFSLRLADRAGQPIGDEPAQVALAEELSAQPLPCTTARCYRTRDDGTYEVRLTEGSYELRAGGEKAASKRLPPQVLTAASSPMTLTLDAGVKVTGRVAYRDGGAVSEDQLYIRVKEQPHVLATLEGNGTFSIAGLLPGRITLLGQRGRPGSASQIVAAPVEVDAPASGVVIEFPRPARIEGRITEKESGAAITEFSVAVQSGTAWSVTAPTPFRADDGRYVLEDVPTTATQLVVTAPGYVTSRVSGLTLEEGKGVTADVALERGVRLVGHATSDGRPVAGVSVSLTQAGPTMRAMRDQGRMATTDENGDYAIDGVAVGAHRVEFSKSGYVAIVKSVETTAGKDGRLDVELERGREIAGRVVDASGAPVSGAMVFVESRGYASRGNLVNTDGEGAFRLEGLAEGRYTLRAEKTGYVQGRVEDVEAVGGRSVTITLSRGGTVTGHVIGLNEQELGQAMVMATSGRGSRTETRVDAGGRFTLTGVADGEVMVTARLMGSRRGQSAMKNVTVLNGSAPPVELDFSAGTIVRGRVLRAGKPLAGGFVTFRRMSERQAVGYAEPGMTGPDGTYEVRVPEAGEYRINVSLGQTSFDGGSVVVSGGMQHDIELRGAMLRGRVVDSETGAPLTNVSVQLRRPSAPEQWTTSDTTGAFLFDLVSDDTYQLTASRDRYATATERIDVRGGAVPDVELRLQRGTRVAIRVVDAADNRALDASVRISDTSDQSLWMGMPTRGEDGALSLWLQPGSYTATVFSPGYSAGSLQLIVPGPEVTVTLTRAVR